MNYDDLTVTYDGMVRISGNYSQMASTFSFVNYRDSALNTLLSPIITLCWFGFDPHISMIWGLNPYHQRLYNIKKGPGYPSGFTTSKKPLETRQIQGGPGALQRITAFLGAGNGSSCPKLPREGDVAQLEEEFWQAGAEQPRDFQWEMENHGISVENNGISMGNNGIEIENSGIQIENNGI